ncbi:MULTISPECIES: 1-acyl-sn-glycerol-3-phosphate acyltransferase [Aerococcus]|uniref:1-acyl-sn-glycerol-3-phosphate acyltransferase n=1 Tax=Aerococcus sanguinicola TaxID=119206 RepID=A0A5N1GMH1_9LACT|nr:MULTISPECIES: lysophospholipid acyltransferase family protein [Aerococcus]KAA9301992.1 1-acyl-sn-glycerol-3-phosphate acyltransferase [Aerococcus sanguinicola]MDK6368583.1 lysophospholipid acyltransferase family protein [Aerococcus sp. UMB9870]MDK6679666.1 lysophospholipid acyltransferase family protein [Aerococcus sp. UMB8608]MDK6686510.1 lysophospholipid acyltransferase family protein [Aerococcus sp. UMB8623]MDK6940868.1 lysophospholipid acyltransferase family protein [Aerococcus sp. UMB8
MYRFFVILIRCLLRVVNGKPHYEFHPDYTADETYVVVSPHRSLLDPPVIAAALYPDTVFFLAKKELFDIPVFGWLIRKAGMIPIDRSKPGRAAMKECLTALKEGHNIGIFPTGSRYSSEIKAGASMLAGLSKKRLLPVVYQGPLQVKGLFSRKAKNRVKVRVGAPIDLPDKKRLKDDDLKALDEAIARAFEATDAALDPNYYYDIEAAKAQHAQKKK